MRIAILGGGITGLTASYFLGKKGHQVTLFEKEKIFGGLAAGFKQPNWNWYLEQTYHHLFANDNDILDFAREIGFDKIFFRSPETASLFNNETMKQSNNLTIFPLDTPLDFLKFPYLDIFNKFRAGSVLAFLKLSPFFPFYEKRTAEEFIKKTMGETVWKKMWQELFRKKFGRYAGIILASFIWARIKKRTKSLGYIEGGFQTFINYLVNKLKSLRINLLTGYEIKEIRKQGKGFIINNRLYDAVISTLPTPILTKVAQLILSKIYLNRLSKIKYLHALTLILETKESLLEKTYWLNVSTPNIPIMGIVQHTNFMNKQNYGGNHIVYLGWYLKREDKLMRMNNEELLNYVIPYMNKISNFKFLISKQTSNFKQQISNFHVFRSPFAQPIFDKEFLQNKPDFKTPLKNFFIANLDMTYPYDRGINYAVKLGKKVTKLI